MSLLVLCSAHGAPGVTTTALALAGVWPEHRDVLLVEADGSGGVLTARFGLADSPGLVSLAAGARSGTVSGEVVRSHSQQLEGGLRVLVAPPSAALTRSVLEAVTGPMVEWARADNVDLVVDAGRLFASSPSRRLVDVADRVLVVCQPSVDQLRPAAHLLASFEGQQASLLLVGNKPYGQASVADVFDVAVAGEIAWDAPAAAALAGGGRARGFGRSQLIRSAATLTETLVDSGRTDGRVVLRVVEAR